MLDEKVIKCFELRKKYLEKSKEKTEAHNEWEELFLDITGILKSQNPPLPSFTASTGRTFEYGHESSFRVPKDEENKKKFFEWLKAQGLYDAMITVNSQTLNGLLKEKEAAFYEEGGIAFEVPGIEMGAGRPVPKGELNSKKL